jgi:hypothetical protein
MAVRSALVLLLAAFAPAIPLAEEPAAGPPASATTPGRVGLGLAFGSDRDVSFLVPIQVSPALRIEPALGASNPTFNSPGGPVEAHAFKAGLGVAWTAPVAGQVRASLGGRLEVAYVGYSGSGSQAWSVRGAAVAGAEWFVVPRVSLGLEAQAGYAYSNGAEVGLGVVPGTGFDTAGLVVARIFPW